MNCSVGVFWMCLLGTAVSADSVKLSSVVIGHDRITIVVPIAVVGGPADSLATWREGIERAWNRGNNGGPYVVCGRAVRLEARFLSGERFRPAGTHLLLVEPYAARTVSSVWTPDDQSPTVQARTAVWAEDLQANLAAHEFGHLLGLMDEYTETDENGNGVRDPGEGSVPDVARYPDAWLSIMAFEHGTVLERHIHEVLARHGAAEALDCSSASTTLPPRQ